MTDRLQSEDGFTLVEVLIAATIMVVGILTTLTAIDASRKLTLVSERRTTMFQRAQQELERVKSMPYSQVALTTTSSQWSTTSGSYTYVNQSAGTCPSGTGAAPTYASDQSQGGSGTAEPLVLDGCSYTINGTSVPVTAGTIAPVSPWSVTAPNGTTTSGYIYDFITWTTDPTCSQTQTPGSNCSTGNDYKRITIVATLNGATTPHNPVIVSGYIADPNQNSSQNLLHSPTTSCLNSSGQTVSCSNTLNGTPHQYFLSDSSYTSSGSTPACTGNPLHNTLVASLGLIGTPDLLGSALPSGTCTNGSGSPTTPDYATDVSGSAQGLPVTPTTPVSSGGNPVNGGCGTAPPIDNSKSHSWVTSNVPVGTTMNLTGGGSFTAYLMSGSGVAANVTVCLGVYVLPGGLIGQLLSATNLISHPIGAVVYANATAQVGVPTPVSFNFSLGSAAAVTGDLLGTRIAVMLWLAASAGTNVTVSYDQAQMASQLTLVTSS